MFFFFFAFIVTVLIGSNAVFGGLSLVHEILIGLYEIYTNSLEVLFMLMDSKSIVSIRSSKSH